MTSDLQTPQHHNTHTTRRWLYCAAPYRDTHTHTTEWMQASAQTEGGAHLHSQRKMPSQCDSQTKRQGSAAANMHTATQTKQTNKHTVSRAQHAAKLKAQARMHANTATHTTRGTHKKKHTSVEQSEAVIEKSRNTVSMPSCHHNIRPPGIEPGTI